MERECMEFDVLVVGGGPAGLSAACRIKQLAIENNKELSVCVVEKGSEIGAHILSGAVFEPRALDELFPDWQQQGAPVITPVNRDETLLLTTEQNAITLPQWAVPETLHNNGNYIISLGNLCRWLAEQAESMGVEVYPGFSASEAIIDDNNRVRGVVTGDMGLDKNGQRKGNFEQGIELRARYTLFSEGARGHIGKKLIEHYALAEGVTAQHYAIGFKELWEIPPEQHQPGIVVHGLGWPLTDGATGGSYLYHLENNQVAVGLIVDLNYSNPYLSPFEEFQRLKHHPMLAKYLQSGNRISYGARAITKGGLHSLPSQQFSGGLLIGCDAGTLNPAKIKGTHCAMKSGMIAAEAVFDALETEAETPDYANRFNTSWLYDELYRARNFSTAVHRFGSLMGGGIALLEQNLLKGKTMWNLRCDKSDYSTLKLASDSKPINYSKPDGKLSFDKLSSVYLSNTFHEEDQPCHLVLKDLTIPIAQNLPDYAEPAQRYCPAGVYEIIAEGEEKQLQINAANCIHCKTCDIKDPSQNITWLPPEGGGGPNYPNM
ncbi:electron transfer flavoprotein-ubiquinone oxidoreductase [Vibrio sp. SCSIO 43137]|uniref:electron transfer flavoprotein-ubiquinone oxidoreductase n=1 Tax=Vibrio sp. SCSIO 43137 TaxID=3021011 RepID=UPI002307B423|nr:electron transfer flavoprotein-ubiquinone oxidoreductase [Vibrio sp. SCSIO 43137]WCE28490.1 electron transfer flavoprotein-ubiquinone oxidoreductase [Vibrio sp. SCSIO 43137]